MEKTWFALSLAFVTPFVFCRFLRNSFASAIDPNGSYDTPLSWGLEGDDQQVAKIICDTTMIQ